MAPGGQTAFEDEDGKLYLVYHQRFAKTGELHEPRVCLLYTSMKKRVHRYFLTKI